LRPRIQSRHDLSDEEIDTVLEAIARSAVIAAPRPSTLYAPDRGDQHVWDLLDTFPDAVLVTGDELLRARKGRFEAFSPRELLELEDAG
jgi:hypothetical protein